MKNRKVVFMKKLFLLVLGLAFWSMCFAQTTETVKDSLMAEKQVTQEQYVQRPSFRWVSGNASVNDSIRVDIYTNGVLRKRVKYTVTQAPLDVNNATRAVVTGYIDDFSK